MNNDLISRILLRNEFVKYIDVFDLTAWNKINDIIDNAPTASPICIANVHFDKEQMQDIVDKAIADYQLEPIRCKDCKHQKKYWHEDKRMKEKGYWIYGCDLIDDSFIGTPVWGSPDQYCSSAERRLADEQEPKH